MEPDKTEGYRDIPGIQVQGISDIVEQVVANLDESLYEEEEEKEAFYQTLEGHILKTFEENKNARDQAGVDREMIESVYQVNGEYTPEEIANMPNRSKIFMNLTATKKRAGVSWIQDILQPANAFPMEFRPTPLEELPSEIEDQIRAAFEQDQQELIGKLREKYAQQPQEQQQQQVGPDGQPVQQEQKPPTAMAASRELREMNELKRDLQEAITSEINKEANQQCRMIQRVVLDDLKQGSWDTAFSEFINDFLVFPTAFIKGPIVTTSKKLTYENGKPKEIRDIIFMNKRVSPFDIYPSPSADSIYDGNFIEHIRLSRKDLSALAHMKKAQGYKRKNIIKVLNETPQTLGTSNNIEETKAVLEKRGSQDQANIGIYNGIHFWGTASVKLLKDWGMEEEDLEMLEDWEEVEIEAILVNHSIIKCCINRDPLGRRPYYSASYSKRPGSIWGKSMPASMRDIQRMCNGAARALADNMGLSAGPQCAILVDRLAADGAIEEQRPHMIWQFTSDPQGNGGRPIEWFTIPSNANELLAVYDRFEIKADDVTGIPRYAYGNEQVGGAGQTMGGLNILMESASKGIKSAIKNISEGVLVPRAEYQFYLHLLKEEEEGNPVNYHGDINVIVYAAEAITLKAMEQEVQRELLKATANEYDMSIIGKVGRADMLRKTFKTANFNEDIVPSRLEVKQKDIEDQQSRAQQQKQAMQLEQQKQSIGLEATKVQVGGQQQMHQESMQMKREVEQLKAQLKARDQELKAVQIDQQTRIAAGKIQSQEKIATETSQSKRDLETRKLSVNAQLKQQERDIREETGGNTTGIES